MQRYPAHLVQQARRLVSSKNISYKAASKILSVSPQTISIWCSDLKATRAESNIKRHEAIRVELLNSEIYLLKNLNINTETAKIYCSLIYGCEGAKYPASTHLALTNSDPNLALTFLQLFRLGFELDETKFRVLLQLHSNHNEYSMLLYWSQLLNIPVS